MISDSKVTIYNSLVQTDAGLMIISVRGMFSISDNHATWCAHATKIQKSLGPVSIVIYDIRSVSSVSQAISMCRTGTKLGDVLYR